MPVQSFLRLCIREGSLALSPIHIPHTLVQFSAQRDRDMKRRESIAQTQHLVLLTILNVQGRLVLSVGAPRVLMTYYRRPTRGRVLSPQISYPLYYYMLSIRTRT
jgi:hypothetical protein